MIVFNRLHRRVRVGWGEWGVVGRGTQLLTFSPAAAAAADLCFAIRCSAANEEEVDSIPFREENRAQTEESGSQRKPD